MSELSVDAWDTDARAAWMAPQFSAPDDEVRRYGSGFAMEPGDNTFAEGANWFALRASRAVGGLSNYWGAAVLPYRQEDIDDWPITADDLAPHYRAVADWMPISGRQDDLAPLFPAFSMATAQAIAPTAQAEVLLSRLTRKAPVLADMGVQAGMARQAVDPSCQACGLCLHGCPWSLIYSARHTCAAMRDIPNFTYQPGMVVQQIREEGEGVLVSLADGRTYQGERVFLATGVLETARILLASPGLANEELILKDSQHAFLPLLHHWQAPRRPDRQPYQTLPQLFAELDEPAISPRLIHAQLYTWNEYFARDLRQNYGRLPGIGSILDRVARRLIVAQAFLHSDVSASVALSLAGDGRLAPRLIENPKTASTMRAALDRYSRALRQLGLIGLPFAARLGAPGASFHVGGSLPMAGAPEKGQSDLLGRPKGATRLHVVDASVFPSMPATTITFSVMANAHRIGTLAP
jgi:choline dehydrogenase-like flavoprotein